MPLRYRASLEDNWQPINANTYEFIAPLSVADRHFMRLFAHVVMVAYPPTPGYSQGYERDLSSATPIVDGIITGYELREYGEYRESYNGSETQTFVGIQIRLFTLDEPEGTDWFPAKAAGSYPYLVSGMTGIDNIVVTFVPYSSPPPYVNSPCILRAYLEGVLVFNQLFDGCPYVEVVDQPVCPPDTCEVDCGTHVCCYGSDGVSVFSFSK
jgi:hypothetical protein